ncbi:MAG: hypothetical protein KDC23_12485 [Actinobacteria bacterium]|nr:hypothetical protein [Actinomycetota bacterium]
MTEQPQHRTAAGPAGGPSTADWSARAAASWKLLTDSCVTGRGRRLRIGELTARRRQAAWPLSQVLWCASAVEATGVAPDTPDTETLWQALAWFRSGDAYLDNRPRGRRYYDDNAWIGLVAAQQGLATGEPRWWSRAATVAMFVERGSEPNGGVRWVEGGDTINACSTGAAGLLFAVVAEHASGLAPGVRQRFRAKAQAAHEFLTTALLRSDGLIADHVRSDGSVEPSVWAYNQGLAARLSHLVGDPGTAERLIDAGRRGLPPDALDRQPAVFSCIWWRTLLALHAPSAAAGAVDFLEHAWKSGRDSAGWFTEVTRYDEGVLIDHASITGLMAAVGAGEDAANWLL